MSKYICKYCGKEFDTPQKLGGHVSRCSNNPKSKETYKKIGSKNHIHANFKIYILKCEICGKEYKLDLSKKQYDSMSYKKTCSDECAKKLTALHINKEIKNKKISVYAKNNLCGNALILHNNKEKIISEGKNICTCEQCGKEFDYYTNIIKSKRFCSKECSNIHHSLSLSKSLIGKTGGYILKSGSKKYKKGYYKNIYCDSSWELAFLIYHLDNNLFIERCKEIRKYIYNNKEYKYYPDFNTDNGIIEIKGYITDKTKAKAQYNSDIKILYYNDIKQYYDYAVSKYGDEFWNILYNK